MRIVVELMGRLMRLSPILPKSCQAFWVGRPVACAILSCRATHDHSLGPLCMAIPTREPKGFFLRPAGGATGGLCDA